MIDILIVEDEGIAADHLKNLICRVEKEANILAILDSIEDAVFWFEQNPQPDLLFLDVQLADGLSFTIFEQVHVSCPIIFCTAYDTFAIKAFSVNSIDYLLKPINQKALSLAIKKYLSLSYFIPETDRPAFNYRDLNSLSPALEVYKTRFTVKSRNKLHIVPVNDIAYFIIDGRYTQLVCKNRSSFLINYSLDRLEEILNPAHFFRINRKYIVSIDAIEEIHLYFKGRYKIKLKPLPEPEQEVIVSSEKSLPFKSWLEK